MSRHLPQWSCWMLTALFLGGCCYTVREEVDAKVCRIAEQPLDLLPSADTQMPMPPAPLSPRSATPTSFAPAAPPADADILLTGAQEPPRRRPPAQSIENRLQIPPGLPGANVPPLEFVPRTATPQEREAAVRRLFPPLPDLGTNPQPQPGPQGRPLTLADLQNLVMSNSPLIRQAASDVEAAKGAAIQAGAYPNPNFGYQADTVGTGATAGFQGLFIEQTIRTAGKLKLAQAAATMDLLNSQLALRRAQFDLMTAVRNGYYGVLVAQENMQIALALTRLTDKAYQVFVDQFRIGGLAAAYEPLQLRAQAFQARGALVQARNRYLAAWKQLAATLGLPAMPLTELVGRADVALPLYRYDAALARVLSTHTDVLTAQNTLQRGRYNLRLAQITPVPDVNLHLAVEKDFSMPPFLTTYSIQLGGPLPIWDQNKGNIIQAQGALIRATEQAHQVRDDLTNRLAAAFEQYENSRVLIDYYRGRILPDQVRAYQRIVSRYAGGDVNIGFLDFLNVQQNLVAAYTTYQATLTAAWTSVVGVADLMQINNLYQFGQEPAPAVPCLEQLQALLCCHPCNRLPDPALKGANGSWPTAAPEDHPPAATTRPEATAPNTPTPTPARPETQGRSIPTWTPSPVPFAWPPTTPAPARADTASDTALYRPPSLRSLQEHRRAAEQAN